ncbi:serine threonine kinase [Canna indica]|uniref:Serine threonine kinase n=1 Tax=Canna indica TaxID=4628 RepID=A0AAQ3QFW5_9LILI|nr:serine threonine kinase [Canna indica]
MSKRQEKKKNTSLVPSTLCRYFTIVEIKAATEDFDESRLLGIGGFGKVYWGEINGGTTKVAIKRGNPISEQEKCLSKIGVERPSMCYVLRNLEFALQLQNEADESGNVIRGISDDAMALMTNPTVELSTTSIEGLTPSGVFSEIRSPKGR